MRAIQLQNLTNCYPAEKLAPVFSETEIDHLTEPFYRTDAARQRRTGGYGLGLYLCKLIVEAHSGQINFQSSSGEGTIVTVQLPVN